LQVYLGLPELFLGYLDQTEIQVRRDAARIPTERCLKLLSASSTLSACGEQLAQIDECGRVRRIESRSLAKMLFGALKVGHLGENNPEQKVGASVGWSAM
jgi:hypothetical protein